MKKPELLSPAGDFERLEFALRYGADAVYLGAQEYGMRSGPRNFTFDEIQNAVKLANSSGKKIYLTLNTIPTNSEARLMPQFIEKAARTGVHAFIVSDLGVLSMVKKYAPEVDIHISTQAGIVNFAAAEAAYDLGAKRVVLARELSFEDIKYIRDNTPEDLEIECFVHGAMCMSFSGRCLLSNYFTGRDANRGQCAQPCRWEWELREKTRPGQSFDISEGYEGTYIMNSDDLCMAPYIDLLADAGINSFKIEGRSKSFYYVASVTSAYRRAIDSYFSNPDNWVLPDDIFLELEKTSHRRYSTGFYFGRAGAVQNTVTSEYTRDWELLGVSDKWENGRLLCTQRGKMDIGDEIEILMPGGKVFSFTPSYILSEEGERIQSTPHRQMKYYIDCPIEIPVGSILRKRAGIH